MPASDHEGAGPRGAGPRACLLAAAAHAVVVLLMFEPINAWPLAFVALVPLTWVAATARSTRGAVTCVFLLNVAVWLWLQQWVLHVTTPGYPLLAVYMSLYPAAYVWLVRRVRRVAALASLPWALVVPVLWVGVECVRGKIVFHGYPWYLVGQPLIGWPTLVQSADLFGVYVASFLAAMVAGLVLDLVPAGGTPRRRRVAAAVAVSAVLLGDIAYGLFRVAQQTPLQPGPSVLVIQTNLPQSNKVRWEPEQQFEDFGTFVEQTRAAVRATGGADLIVWPETMLPGMGLDPETIDTLMSGPYEPGRYYLQEITRLHLELGTPILVGSPAYEGLRVVDGKWQWDRHYNSAYMVEGLTPYERYDKVHLTPFGEMMPHLSWWPALENRVLALGATGMKFDLDAGEAPVTLSFEGPDGPVDLATPICFEDTMGRVCRRLLRGGGERGRVPLLVNLSNDGWFGGYPPGRSQHNQAARFRCIENRVPLVRAVNTGQSVAFDSLGNVSGRIGQGRYGMAQEPGYLRVELQLDGRRTVYGRIGDVGAWACLMISIVAGLCSFIRGQRR